MVAPPLAEPVVSHHAAHRDEPLVGAVLSGALRAWWAVRGQPADPMILTMVLAIVITFWRTKPQPRGVSAQEEFA